MAHRFNRKTGAVTLGKLDANRGGNHYQPHMTQAEFIAAQLQPQRKPRKPKPVTLREFSWMR